MSKINMIETSNLIATAKRDVTKKEGNKLLDPLFSPKNYWSNFLEKRKMATIPPLLDNDKIVTDYLTKAEIFNK